jgi:hypothetical protein
MRSLEPSKRLANEAEQVAHGIRHLTVEHGDIESADDEQRLHRSGNGRGSTATAGRSPPAAVTTITWFLGGPDAGTMLAELEALARRPDPGW